MPSYKNIPLHPLFELLPEAVRTKATLKQGFIITIS